MSFNNTNTDILLVSFISSRDATMAGAFAAFTVDFLVYPLDTIKTRVQSPDYRRLYTTNGAVNRSLLRGLYQGIGSVILATLPSSDRFSSPSAGAFFTTYESTKTLLHTLNPTLPTSPHTPLLPAPVLHALASSTAELVSCFILTPAEVLKQNAQMVRKPSPSSSSATSSPTKAFDAHATRLAFSKFRRDPRQLWRGYTALAARNLPFTAMQFPLFESLRARIHAYRSRRGLQTGSLLETGMVTAVSAGAAGSLAAVVTTPVDVVKTRIMLAAGGDGEQQAAAVKGLRAEGRDAKAEIERVQQAAKGGRGGGWAVGKEVLRSEGVRGLFRGGALRGAWTALGSGLYLGVYESGRRGLERRRVGDEGVAPY
ncbi:MAG: hypothetical protein Q9208_001015 [Pyrenodesmia sp. 3 TL-2023]